MLMLSLKAANDACHRTCALTSLDIQGEALLTQSLRPAKLFEYSTDFRRFPNLSLLTAWA